MFRKTILTLAAVIALAAWASAKPGTWGKEQAQDKDAPGIPAVKFNRWLNDFSAAYQQRDGEKMDELLKDFEGAKAEFPEAGRIEKWMSRVKEAYDGQDVQKMGHLLDNARMMRERVRQQARQNRMNRMGRNPGEGFGPQNRPMRGGEGDFRGRDFGAPGDMDARPFNRERGQGLGLPERMGPNAQQPGNDRAFEGRAQRFNENRAMSRPEGDFRGRDFGPRQNMDARPYGQGFGRPERIGPSAQMPENDRAFEGRGQRFFDARRPMNSPMRPEGFAGGRSRQQMGRDGMGPRMRNNFERQDFEPGMPRQPYRNFNDNITENFWD